MRRIQPGGFTVFSPSLRPNVFSPVGVEDLIERQGESAIWFRMQPCPCPPEKRMSNCGVCLDGQIRTFQETVLREYEMVKADGNFLFPRYAPISRVKKVEVMSEGEKKPLDVVRVESDRVEIRENLPDWAAVQMDYEVSLIEEAVVHATVSNSFEIQFQDAGGVLVGVDHLYVNGKPEEFTGFRFDTVTLPSRMTGDVRAHVRIMPPVKVGYRTAEMRTEKTDKVGIKLEAGEVEFTVPGSFMIGEGDYITLLSLELRASQYVPFQEGPLDYLTYSPIASILNLFEKQGGRIIDLHEGEDFVLHGNERIRWLGKKPLGGYSVMYTYHPTFRIQSDVTGSGMMDRRLPRQYRARPASSYNVR